jgi:hypothetical protein
MLSDKNYFIFWVVCTIINVFGLYKAISKLKNKRLCLNFIFYLMACFCGFLLVSHSYKKLQKNVKK